MSVIIHQDEKFGTPAEMSLRNLRSKMGSWNSPERSWLFKKRYLSHA